MRERAVCEREVAEAPSLPFLPFAERVCGAARVAEEEGSGPGAVTEGRCAAVPARPFHCV